MLMVQGLPDAHARKLLASVVGVSLDERVRERIVDETRGNPLALLELPRALTPAELASGVCVPAGLPLSGRIEEGFQRRLEGLPAATQRLLLVGAAEPIGDPVLLWRAAERLGLGLSAAEAAEAGGLLTIGTRVTFRHPLVRSAIYRTASPQERRAVHRALAEATDPEVDPDRRAWHRANATSGPDEAVAAELERSAARAQARGGLAAAAAFLERSAALTLDPALRATRALAAAQAKHQAGALDAALGLVTAAESGPLDEFQRAQVEVLRAQISFAASRGSDAPPLLLKAAKRLELLDAGLARAIYLDALSAAVFAGPVASGDGVREVAAAVRAAPPSPPPPRAPDLLLDGLALLITEGHPVGAPMLRRAVTAFCRDEVGREEERRWLWLAARAAALLWDYESWDLLSARQVQLSRDAGALGVLPVALSTRAGVYLFAGELDAAASLADELVTVTEATGGRVAPYRALGLAAFRGREAEASELIETRTKDFVAGGEGMGLIFAQWATAVLCNGLGRYEDALAAARRAAEDPNELWFSTWGSVELIEAAIRSGNTEQAVDVLERLSESTRADGRHRSPLASARERRRGCRDAVPRRNRPARPHPPARGPRSRPSALRRMAAPRAPPARRPDPAARRASAVHAVRHGGVRRTRSGRAGGDRRARPQTDSRNPRRPDPTGSADLPPRSRGSHKPRDCRAAVHQREHRRLPPPQGVPQARRKVTHPARPPLAPTRHPSGADGAGALTSTHGHSFLVALRSGRATNRGADPLRVADYAFSRFGTRFDGRLSMPRSRSLQTQRSEHDA
jgi:hypothetical protein